MLGEGRVASRGWRGLFLPATDPPRPGPFFPRRHHREKAEDARGVTRQRVIQALLPLPRRKIKKKKRGGREEEG